MSITAKPLINSKLAAASATNEYTCPASTKTIIDKFSANNTDVSAVTITIHIVPSSGSVADSNKLISAQSLAAGASYDFTILQNQILSAGDAIHVFASVASKMVIRASGREIA